MSEEDEERVRQIVRDGMTEILPLLASGGYVRGGRSYVVGERPCELYFDKDDRRWKGRPHI